MFLSDGKEPITVTYDPLMTDEEFRESRAAARRIRLMLILAFLLIATGLLILYVSRFSPGFHVTLDGTFYNSGIFKRGEGGVRAVGDKWYLFDENGYLKSGWCEKNGKPAYALPSGRLVTGIVTVGGEKYCFDENCEMVKNAFYAVTEDETKYETYYFDENGRALRGWQEIGGKTYHFSDTYAMSLGKVMVDGKLRYFTETGSMVKGFRKSGERTYYFDEEGAAAEGLTEIDGWYYWFGEDRSMVTGFFTAPGEDVERLYGDDGRRGSACLVKYDGNTYYTDENGVIQTGDIEYNGHRYFFYQNGVMKVGWSVVGDKRQYYKDGVMAIGWTAIEDGVYYFDDDGFLVTGDYEILGDLYHFEKNGQYGRGWFTYQNKKYYNDDFGFHMKGLIEINGWCYYFDETTGEMATGWHEEPDGSVYWFESSGFGVKGLKLIDGTKYYFDEETAILYTGFVQIEGFTYYFDGRNGALTGTHEIEGVEYTFAENGILASEIENGRK